MKYLPIIPIFLLLALLAHGADIILRGTVTLGGDVPADVYLASNQTFTGTNTFNETILGTATNANTVGGELPAALHDAANLTGTASAIDGSAIVNVDALTLGGHPPSAFAGEGDVFLGADQTLTGTNTFGETILGTSSNATALHGNTGTPLYVETDTNALAALNALTNIIATALVESDIGVTVQAYDADLATIATPGAQKLFYSDTNGTMQTLSFVGGGSKTVSIKADESGPELSTACEGDAVLSADQTFTGTNTFGETILGTSSNATTVGGELPSAFQDASANLTTLATLNGGSLTNLTAANIPRYNGFEEITSEANIVLNPTKSYLYCTLTNAATLSMSPSAARERYEFWVLGTNTLSLNVSHMIIKGTFTQNATNIITILPEPTGTNWAVGVVN